MDSFIKNIKKKLSVDNLVEMIKDSKALEEDAIKEEEVRKTLGKLDPNTVVDVDDMAGKLNELSEEAREKARAESSSAGKKIIDAAKGVLSKKDPEEKTGSTENDYMKALGREENVFKLYDDFN